MLLLAAERLLAGFRDSVGDVRVRWGVRTVWKVRALVMQVTVVGHDVVVNKEFRKQKCGGSPSSVDATNFLTILTPVTAYVRKKSWTVVEGITSKFDVNGSRRSLPR